MDLRVPNAGIEGAPEGVRTAAGAVEGRARDERARGAAPSEGVLSKSAASSRFMG